MRTVTVSTPMINYCQGPERRYLTDPNLNLSLTKVSVKRLGMLFRIPWKPRVKRCSAMSSRWLTLPHLRTEVLFLRLDRHLDSLLCSNLLGRRWSSIRKPSIHHALCLLSGSRLTQSSRKCSKYNGTRSSTQISLLAKRATLTSQMVVSFFPRA